MYEEEEEEEEENEDTDVAGKPVKKQEKNDKTQQKPIKNEEKQQKSNIKKKKKEENKLNYENERDHAMRKFYDSFALIEEGKYKRNLEKMHLSYDDKNVVHKIEEKHNEDNTSDAEGSDSEENAQRKKKKNNEKELRFDENKIDQLIQSRLDKALLNPKVAKKWLENQKYDKEFSFLFTI